MRFHLLDIMRGLAALWVFAFHTFPLADYAERLFGLAYIFSKGYLGVDMFFVVSGYSLMASAKNAIATQESVPSFLSRRLIRIAFPFWASILLVILLPFLIEVISSLKTGRFIYPSAETHEFFNFSLANWFRIISLTEIFYPFTNIIYLSDKFNSINSVYWTLAIEVQFYLVIALGLRFKKLYTTAIIVSILSLLSLYIPELLLSGIFLPYWLPFGMGILLFYLMEQNIRPSRYRFGKCFAFLAVALLVIGLFALSADIRIYSTVFALCFTLLVWLAEVFERKYQALISAGNRGFILLSLLGTISYSIYLIHAKAIRLVEQILRQVLSAQSILFPFISLILTLIVCYAFYFYFERPFIKKKVG